MLDNNTCWWSSIGGEVSAGFFVLFGWFFCGWLQRFYENDTESELMVIQRRQQYELSFVLFVCGKIILNCKNTVTGLFFSSKPPKNQC